MEWPSKQQVSARLSQAFIQHVLLLLPILKHRHEDSKAKALASRSLTSRSLTSAEKASNLVKAELFEDPDEGLLQSPHGVIMGSTPLPGSMRANKYGSLIVMEAPMQLCVESIDQIKALLGEFAKSRHQSGGFKFGTCLQCVLLSSLRHQFGWNLESVLCPFPALKNTAIPPFPCVG